MEARYIEIRWHARAGQGAVTAAKTLAEALIAAGLYVQAFPEYGPEREGAPLRAYNRISEEPIALHAQVRAPDAVVVLDPTLVAQSDVLTEGAKPTTIFVVNSPKPAAEVARRLPTNGDQRVWTVDATRIALDTLGRPLPNTVMLGALARAAGVIGLPALTAQLQTSLGRKVQSHVLQANCRALERGYKEVKSDGEP